MIDSYLHGKVERISPEAPVPVLNVTKREARLGGAANVALNLKSLGAEPTLVALIGNDVLGKEALRLMEESKLSIQGLVVSESRPTTVKQRVIAGSQQMLRIDEEVDTPASAIENDSLFSIIEKLLPEAQVVIFEDYDKGVISKNIIQRVVALAKDLGIPTTVDPKKRNFLSYEGVTLFKPNLKELKEGFPQVAQLPLKEQLLELKTQLGIKAIMATLSEKGVVITDGEEFIEIKAHIRQIADVSGAGDTVISIASLALAIGLPLRWVAELSNLGGGLVCEKLGVVPIDKKELFAEANRLFLNEQLA